MSISYSAVGWNRQKRIYDLVILSAFIAVLAIFALVALSTHPEITAETILIRGSALTALIFLHVLLAIGPLTRIDSRFLPLLYNRRHLGVAIFLIGVLHAILAIFQFHALGNIPARLSFITSYFSDYFFWRSPGSLAHIPFEPFGLLTLLIFFVMAATSHDFWLKALGAAVWKKIHLFVYVAYLTLVTHISFGLLQSERNVFYFVGLALAAGLLVFLHLLTFFKDRDRVLKAREIAADGFQLACKKSDLREGRARTIDVGGERIALFLHENSVSAVSNQCRHQGGPLGEGRIIDGCITCPWHGWQYKPSDGCSPPPFKEVIATYETRLDGEMIYVKPVKRWATPNAKGVN